MDQGSAGEAQQRRRQRRPVDEPTLRGMAEAYAGGATFRALVTETGMSYGSVHRRMHLAAEAGLCQVRGRGGARVHPSAVTRQRDAG
jgi:hypothetical protein